MNEDKRDATGDLIEGYIRYMMNEHVFIPLCLLLSLAAQTDRSPTWEKAKQSLHLGSIVAMEWTSNEKVSTGGIMPNTRYRYINFISYELQMLESLIYWSEMLNAT
jgi:hypothetical protein